MSPKAPLERGSAKRCLTRRQREALPCPKVARSAAPRPKAARSAAPREALRADVLQSTIQQQHGARKHGTGKLEADRVRGCEARSHFFVDLQCISICFSTQGGDPDTIYVALPLELFAISEI